MKNIFIRLFMVLSVVSVAAGCIKETFPKGSTVTTEQRQESPNALQYMVNGIPSAMMASGTAGYASSYGYHADFGIAGIHLMTESMLEDFTISGEQGYWWFGAFTQNKSMGADYIYNAYFWDCYYSWIKLANDIILGAGKITEDSDEILVNAVGQAHAFRASFYLDLARLYEPKQNKYAPVPADLLEKGLTVPIVDENTKEQSDDPKEENVGTRNPRAPREKMYKFIFDDLAVAEKYLADAGVAYNQPTVGAVYGLYARAYQELGGTYYELQRYDAADSAYTQAYIYADKAITASGKTPLTKEQWVDPKTGFNDGSTNNSWMWGLSLSVENASNIITKVSHLSSEAVWGYSIYTLPSVNKALYDRIPNDDFRKYSWLDPNYTWDYAQNRGGNYTPNHGYRFAAESNREVLDYFIWTAVPYTNIKFRPADGECLDYTIGNCADHLLMRVEEMHFIKMEAALRISKKTDSFNVGLDAAKALLNEFMQTYRYKSYDCSYLASKETYIEEYLFQKRVEFWGEGILMFDYKRLNKGITRGYNGTNFQPTTSRFNTEGRSPQWNIVITRGEFQSNIKIDQSLNNPDPTSTMVSWNE